jgi:hypothetical protein
MLQELGVVVVVSSAVVFLAKRLFGKLKPRGSASFVPLTAVKRKPKAGCH